MIDWIRLDADPQRFYLSLVSGAIKNMAGLAKY